MKILFTGASSFTGFWFVNQLCENKHQVNCILTGSSLDDYSGVRKARLMLLEPSVNYIFSTRFGDENFINQVKAEEYDLICHHAAYVNNYKEPSFDVIEATKNNTNNVFQLMQVLQTVKCKHLLLTGSVFEGSEGLAKDNSIHFSPYGLSKSLSYQVFDFYAKASNINIAKFVIPNPFGPYEEPRFTAYLMNKWKNNEVPHVGTPDYIRDNIPVALLANYYTHFCNDFINGKQSKISPSSFAGSQGSFTQIVANEVKKRTNWNCEFVLDKQTNFAEPMDRIGVDKIAEVENDFSYSNFWDEFVNYYNV